MENQDPNINKEEGPYSGKEFAQRVERSDEEMAASADLFAGQPSTGGEAGISAQATATAQEIGTKEQVKEKSRQIASQAQQKAMTMMEERKHQIADTLGSVSAALHRGADQLHEQHSDSFGRYADTAAEKVDQFSQILREKDMNYFIGRVEHTARRHPGLFIGGAVALGFCCARFFKSSQPQGGRDESTRQQSQKTDVNTFGEAI